jgi:hypothetical protein
MGSSSAFIGIYHHPSPPDLAPQITSTEVSPTWTNEAIAFASSYFARTAVWLPFL